MKSKKILIVAAFMMIIGSSTLVFAAPAFYTCTVEAVGAGVQFGGTNFISLKDVKGAWGPTWFILGDVVAKEQLAISITAQINNKQVLVMVDPVVAYSAVSNMYLLK